MSRMSVREASVHNHSVKNYIIQCQRSNKREKVFCLVEGEFDEQVYKRHLNTHDVEVRIATDDANKSGCKKVELFVSDIRSMFPNARVIGIRDKDYNTILGKPLPDGVYYTDCRDLEMLILASTSYAAFDSTIVYKLNEVFPYCRHLAYLRIHNEVAGRICRINSKVTISQVYDSVHKQFYVDWKSRLNDNYISHTNRAVTLEEIENNCKKYNLRLLAATDICRGHDVISLLGIRYGLQYHRAQMETNMLEHYSSSEFYSTRLFGQIFRYCKRFGIKANAV